MRTLAALALTLPMLAQAPAGEVLKVDRPHATVQGATFVAPAGWTISVQGIVTLLEAPEKGSRIAFVDVPAKDANTAVAAAWAAYAPKFSRALRLATDQPDKDGWSLRRSYDYITSPNERRSVSAEARHAGGIWSVALIDLEDAVAEKRAGQVALIFGKYYPKGYVRETFTGRKAHPLDAGRIQALGRFVEEGRLALGLPGVAVGLLQDGKVVFSGGFGRRAMDDPKPVDGDTLFMIASNTKALTTLLLARMVDEKRFTWDTKVTDLMPSFRLGDAATTDQVRVRHLICACTGMPRQDLEWFINFGGLTPEKALAMMGGMKPTSKFGELFQYSNLMAGAAGFTAGHVLFPDLPLGPAYDRAMQTYVFDPLGMSATTFDYAKALAGNHAIPHAPDVDGKTTKAVMDINYSIIPLRPAGAAWSNVNDMLRYVALELDEGALPGGKRLIARIPLLERRVAQVPIGEDDTYGMGLEVNTRYGIQVVHHGGDMVGFHSDMIWVPGQGVGAVILTNGNPGWVLRSLFRRKLLEVLFDGKDEAAADLKAAASDWYANIATERKRLTLPAEGAASAVLAPLYSNPALGLIKVTREGDRTVFDFGVWKSEVASRRNPDGTLSFITTAPGGDGLEFVAGTGVATTLTTRDAQHEYVYEARKGD